jgi:hypothetical protein
MSLNYVMSKNNVASRFHKRRLFVKYPNWVIIKVARAPVSEYYE